MFLQTNPTVNKGLDVHIITDGRDWLEQELPTKCEELLKNFEDIFEDLPIHIPSDIVCFGKEDDIESNKTWPGKSHWTHCAVMKVNEKKNEQVPIQLPKAASSLSKAKKMKKQKLSRWTAEIIQFIP